MKRNNQYSKKTEPFISVVIPCYNESDTIVEIINRVNRSDLNSEIIVIDDFSTDDTKEKIKAIENIKIKFFEHSENQGKGAALRTGFQYASGDIVVIQDADLEYNPAEIPKLIQPILDSDADVVYGSRFRGGDAARVLYYWHRLGNLFLTELSNMFTNLNLTDMETCYKAFRKEVIQQIQIEENRFGFEPEITAKISKLRPRIRIYEVGISYRGRTYEEGKKIGWKDGFRAIYAIIKYNLLR